MTFIEMLEKNGELFPEKAAIIYKNERVSYKYFHGKSNALANFLLKKGLKKNDCIGFLVEKNPAAIISFLGVAKAGGIFFPIDHNHTISHIQSILNLTKPAFLIISAKFQPLLTKLKLPLSDIELIVIGPRPENIYYSLEEIFLKESESAPEAGVVAEDIAYLNFTSGTTGTPKGAICTYANIYWNTISSIKSLGLTHEDIHLCMFPVFSHPHELFARALYLGGTIVLIDDFLPKSIAEAITTHKVTCMMAIALAYDSLVRYHVSCANDFSSLRVAESGGMHVSPSLFREFKEHFNVSIIPVWGSTETSGIALATPADTGYHPGSMGKPCPYYEIKIIDEAGKELQTGEIGEMVIKGPAVCSGYFENPNETEQHMKDGWLYTDDLVKKDDEGYFYFASRKSGMIKVAGLRVFPTEIEDVLRSHPKIAEAAVVKIRDQLLGETPKAVIVLKEGQSLTKEDIRKFCGKRMEKYKVPNTIEFLPALPKTPSGKILYREL
jgi:long-chain acyl-CoA synthetase